jgi:hypothetical protein
LLKKSIRSVEPIPAEGTPELADKMLMNSRPVTSSDDVSRPGLAKAAGASSLPQFLTPFIGRTLELLDLDNLLRRSGTCLKNLMGPRGTGKTV